MFLLQIVRIWLQFYSWFGADTELGKKHEIYQYTQQPERFKVTDFGTKLSTGIPSE